MGKTKVVISDQGSRIPRFFSESFKREKVQEIERNLISVTAISKEFSVTRAAVYKWVYKYSLYRKRQIRQIIEPMSDSRKIEELRARIKELERMVGQKQIEIEFKDKMIEIAEEKFKIDIKKKLGSKLSGGSGAIGESTAGK